ncbi:MAG: SMC family ATPase [Candidatus Aenigmarchaeota archaeon]|nr:SMC family ATPase [Candidatus Aenigmarchaeota archaeon]
MILGRLKLNNIRSYVNEDVQFPAGAILFEGDVGSGKTTILIAIEFALFGLSSDLKGDHILRAGSAKGFVELSVNVAGKELILHRGLEKTNGKISQTDCYLEFDGLREDYSVTEMKSRVLSILGFNEKTQPQASSVIYRYAVFTPQEKMKEILSSDADERLETIRRAFMMEDYKNAVSNAEEFRKLLRLGIRAAESDIADLENLRENIKAYENERGYAQNDISKLAELIEKERAELNSVSETLENLRKLREKHASLSAEIDSLSRMISNEEKNMQSMSQKSISISSRMDALRDKMKILGDKKTSAASEMTDLTTALGIEDSILNIDENRITGIRSKIKSDVENSLAEITRTKTKLQDMESLLTKGVCPVCEQNIDTTHFTDRMNGQAEKLTLVEKALKEKRVYEAAADNLVSLLSYMKNLNTEAEMLAQSYADEINRQKELSEDIEKSIKSIADANKNKDALSEEIKNLGLEIVKIADLESKERLHRKSLETLSSEHSAKGQRLKDLAIMIESDAERVKSMELKLERIKAAKECSDWLGAYFIPSVENIERHVFAVYNRNFDAFFKKWFSMLMDSGEIAVRVDDKFTPVIEQNGYEQDVDALSGGEKTSVALAYRLALNTVVKEIAISLRNNLLILDEPTDGFSKEQLHRMRDILNELQCDQVIIVSHEKELEAFVDNIIEVRKEGNVSKIAKR